jgi:hypothetical protein
MARSSTLDPETQALVDAARRVREAIEGLCDAVEERQSLGARVTVRKLGQPARGYYHATYDCAGEASNSIGAMDRGTEGWRSTIGSAVCAIFDAIQADFSIAMPDQAARKLVWRRYPEARSITSEIGDLFNVSLRLALVPANWIVEFPEDEEPNPGLAGVSVTAPQG